MTRNRIADEVSSTPDAGQTLEPQPLVSESQLPTSDSPPLVSAPQPSAAPEPSRPPQPSRLAQLKARLAGMTRRLPSAQLQSGLARVGNMRALPWVIVLGAAWITGITAFQRLSGLPAVPNCDRALSMLTDSEQLDCAEKSARQRDEKSLAAALKLATSFREHHPLHGRASRLTDQWASSLLGLARQKLEQGDLKQAVAIANKVPASSQVYPEAQKAMQAWETSWNNGETLYRQAQEDIKEQDWTPAMLKVRDLVKLGDDYWQDKAENCWLTSMLKN